MVNTIWKSAGYYNAIFICVADFKGAPDHVGAILHNPYAHPFAGGNIGQNWATNPIIGDG